MIITQGLGSNLLITQGYGNPMYVFLVMIAMMSSEEYMRTVLDSEN
jgi:hypothetical protein